MEYEYVETDPNFMATLPHTVSKYTPIGSSRPALSPIACSFYPISTQASLTRNTAANTVPTPKAALSYLI